MKADTQEQAFASLTPDRLLDAVESTGVACNGQMLALNSYENRVYQVGLENGPPLVAKFYRPKRWSDEAIQEEHHFTLELAQQELPIIAPLINEEGRTLLYHEGSRFALYPCKGGRAPELDDPSHLLQMGRFIARIHLLGSSRDFQHRPSLDVESFLIQPSRLLLENEFIPTHLVTAYETLLVDLKGRVAECYRRAGTFKTIRLHGDCHPGNILWREDGPQVVDFDDARMGPAIQDLWMFLSGDRGYMTERVADLLEGYSQFYDFNPAELYLLEALRTMRLVHYTGWIAKRWYDPAFPMAFPWFDTTAFWEDHILTLREQLAKMDEPPIVW
jgi:Ser/Thr protein kinase RdoA (MazF antagonist)